MVVRDFTDGVFTIENLLSPAACQAYIRLGEDIGFKQALLAGHVSKQEVLEIRNNYRVILDSFEIAESLYQKTRVHLRGRTDGYAPCGANERVRFYRYEEGQRFDWHSDGYYVNAGGQRSRLTILVYLNEGFEAGDTCFRLPDTGDIEVTPREGMALIFPHSLVHKARTVTAGTKYVLRTDIMCKSAIGI